MLGRASESVELCDNEGVSFTDEIECGFKLRSFSNRRNLLGKDLFASGSSEVPDLGIKAGVLFQSARATVSNLQARLPSQLIPGRYEPTVSKWRA